MNELMKSLEGKRTNILVVSAIVIYFLGVVVTPNGVQLNELGTDDISYMLLIGCISTFKMGLERAIKAA